MQSKTVSNKVYYRYFSSKHDKDVKCVFAASSGSVNLSAAVVPAAAPQSEHRPVLEESLLLRQAVKTH